MTTTEITNSSIPLKLKVLHVLRLILGKIARFFFSFYYGSGGEKIPPITDDILKVSATEVARRIRNKEVCTIYEKLLTFHCPIVIITCLKIL